MSLTTGAAVLAKRLKDRRLPSVDIPDSKEGELTRALQGMQEHLRMYEGDSNAPKQRFITMQELEDAGLITSSVKNKFAFISQVQGQDVVQPGGTSTGSGSSRTVVNNTTVTGSTTLYGLTDTNVTGAATGEYLRYTGTEWQNYDLLTALAALYEPIDATIVRTGDAAWNATDWDTAFGWGDHASGGYAASSHTHLLAAGATDVTATAAEVNLLDLAALTAGWVLSADTATTASWKAPAGGGGGDVTKVGTPVDNQVGVWTGDGTIEGDASLTFDGTFLLFLDNIRSRFGTGADGDIWFDGVDLNVSTTGTSDIIFTTAAIKYSVWMEADAGVHLYYNNSEKIVTTNTGVSVTGDVAATSHGGITEANLVDKSATETVSGAWNFSAADVAPATLTSKLSANTLYLDGKEAIAGSDTWLRLNQNNAFTSGIYTPGGMRIDGILQHASTWSITAAGAIAAVSFGGITSANLVDKSAAETITGAWDFSGVNTVTAGNLLFIDNVPLRFGTSNDLSILWDGVDLEITGLAATQAINFRDGAQLFMYGPADVNYLRIGHDNTNGEIRTNSGAIALTAHGYSVSSIFTQDHLATGQTTGAVVRTHGGGIADVGLNVLPLVFFNVSDTLEAQHCGRATGKSNTTTTYKLTGPTSSDVDFPVGGVAHVWNLGASGNYTLEDTATCTMYFCDGSAAPVDIALNGTLAPGGMITLWRYSTTAIYITGSGFTP